MQKAGLDCRLASPFNSVERIDDNTMQVNLADGTTIQANKVLSALGRPPNVEPLELDKAGVEVVNGAIKVDDYQNTNVPKIYAIGDATNQVNLTPVAIRQGRLVSERIFNDKPDLKMCYDNIATVIFSHPPIGTVGLSEEKAVEKFGADKVKVYKSNFINMFYSPGQSDQMKLKSLIKIICHIEDDG